MREVAFDSVTSPDGRFTATVTHRLSLQRRPVVWRIRVVENSTGEVVEHEFSSTRIGESVAKLAHSVEWDEYFDAVVFQPPEGTGPEWWVRTTDWPKTSCEPAYIRMLIGPLDTSIDLDAMVLDFEQAREAAPVTPSDANAP